MFAHPGDARSPQLKTKKKFGAEQHLAHQKKHLQTKQSAEAEQVVAMEKKRMQSLPNGLNRMRLNYFHNHSNFKRQSHLTNRNMRQKNRFNGRRLFYPLGRQTNKNNGENIHGVDTMKHRILALENDKMHAKENKVDRIDNRIRALEEEMLLQQHKLPLKEALQVAPQEVKLEEVENVNNVKDVISALDAEPPFV